MVNVSILGQNYKVLVLTEDHYPKLKSANASGLAELYSKQLILNKDNMAEDAETYDNLQGYSEKVLRHEVVHAYFHESGLTGYCQDEVLVDWLAVQLPKIVKSVSEASAVFQNSSIMESIEGVTD